MVKVSDFLEANLRWIIVVAFGIMMVYLDGKYQSVDDAEKFELSVGIKFTDNKELYDEQAQVTEDVLDGISTSLQLIKEDITTSAVIFNGNIEDVSQRQAKKIGVQEAILDKLNDLENRIIILEQSIKHK